MALPEFPQGFTPEYLTESLGGKFLPKGTVVTKVSRSPLGEGTGMMADIEKLETLCRKEFFGRNLILQKLSTT